MRPCRRRWLRPATARKRRRHRPQPQEAVALARTAVVARTSPPQQQQQQQQQQHLLKRRRRPRAKGLHGHRPSRRRSWIRTPSRRSPIAWHRSSSTSSSRPRRSSSVAMSAPSKVRPASGQVQKYSFVSHSLALATLGGLFFFLHDELLLIYHAAPLSAIPCSYVCSAARLLCGPQEVVPRPHYARPPTDSFQGNACERRWLARISLCVVSNNTCSIAKEHKGGTRAAKVQFFLAPSFPFDKSFFSSWRSFSLTAYEGPTGQSEA